MRIIAVVSCKAGVAQTHRVCSALKQAAKMSGDQIEFEVHGPGAFHAVKAEQISTAQVALLVADQPVPSQSRFAGLPCLELSPNSVVKDARSALAAAARIVQS